MKRAFSLVEVLIAVLVLALGLLGLGAIFPAVISEQRRSFDSITGESVAKLVEDTLNRNNELVDLSALQGDGLGRVGPDQGGQNNNAGRPIQINAPSKSVWQNVLDALPRDPASLVTLALLVGVFGLVVIAGISSNGKGKGRGGLSA